MRSWDLTHLEGGVYIPPSLTTFLSSDSKMERDFSETKEPPLKNVSAKYNWFFISDLPYQATVFLMYTPKPDGLSPEIASPEGHR